MRAIVLRDSTVKTEWNVDIPRRRRPRPSARNWHTLSCLAMDPALGLASRGVLFEDALGQRRPIAAPNGADTLEVLCLRPELTSISSFEFALRERVARLAAFRSTEYARVRGVERVKGGSTLALVSERISGIRLADVLDQVERQRARLDLVKAIGLIRQLVPVVARLHEHASDVAHGAVGAERLVLTQDVRLVVVEHVFGAAFEQLRLSSEQLWRDLRIPVASSGTVRFNQRTDILQVGVVALELVLGRRLKADEFPARLDEVVASAWAMSTAGGLVPPAALRGWLMRALQLDSRNAFSSAVDARAELDKLLDAGGAVQPSLELLEEHVAPGPIARSGDSIEVPVPPAPPRPAKSTDQEEPASAEPSSIELGAPPEPDIPWWRTSKVAMLGGAALIVIASGGYAGHRYLSSAPAATSAGELSLNSDPPGARVTVDKESRGLTPVSLSLAPGPHLVELRQGDASRSIPVVIVAGAHVSQYVELPKDKSAFGQLQVRTEPTSAKITLDGIARGTSPLTIGDLVPGAHTVLLESDNGSVTQEVTVEPGGTASLVVPLVPSAQPTGWISISSPVVVQLYEGDRLLGRSDTDRIVLPPGRHDLEMVNESLAYRATRTVQVTPGKGVAVKVDLPKQKIALNAVPWAEVWIDGNKIGETPIGDFSITAGPHEIVFRHPELGEQRRNVTVVANAPTRLSVDMGRK